MVAAPIGCDRRETTSDRALRISLLSRLSAPRAFECGGQALPTGDCRMPNCFERQVGEQERSSCCSTPMSSSSVFYRSRCWDFISLASGAVNGHCYGSRRCHCCFTRGGGQ